MGLFDKKKHDLELHIVLDKGMVQCENDLIERFNKYCETYGYQSQTVKEGRAIDLLNEALLARIEREERIEFQRSKLEKKELEWAGKADICSYNDFYSIMNNTDPMVQKLSQNKSVYLEGYVYEIHWRRDIKAFVHHFYLVPYPCDNEHFRHDRRSDIEYLLNFGQIQKIKITAPFSILHAMKKGDYVQITGETRQFSSKGTIEIEITKIKLPDKPEAIIPTNDPEFKVDWKQLELEETERSQAEWEDFVKNFPNET